MSLRLALFGQAPLAIVCLDRLQEEGHDVRVVYAPEDGSRPDVLAAHARNLGISVMQRNFFQRKDGSPISDALNEYKTHEVDLNILASFTSFLPPSITNSPKHKSICYHPSLLPKYRGGHALQWQIINGVVETGVSIFMPDTGIDTGPIVIQKSGIKISPNETAGSLFFKKLAPLGADAILEAVTAIDTATASFMEQNETEATFDELISESAATIDLKEPAEKVDQLIRGCDPQPGAHLRYSDMLLKLYDVSLLGSCNQPPGTITGIDDDAMVLALNGGSLRIGRVRGDNGKEPASVFLKRHALELGAQLTESKN